MEKNWNAMEKLWKSYGISFLGICTNPECISVRSTTCASTLNEDPSEMSDFRDIAELCGSARLSQIPRSSLSQSTVLAHLWSRN